MAGRRDEYVIAQFSDIHCGDPRFDEALMLRVVRGVNAARPDLVVVAGDLTDSGYAEQFADAAAYIDLVDCRQRVVIAGNHDCRHVGYVHHERIFGPRDTTATFDFPVDETGGTLRVVAMDSNIPDLNDGQLGRAKIATIATAFSGSDSFRLFVLHHHLVGIPGTGRERNVVWDAGDVLHALREAKADLVLAGHKHVPYAWPVGEMLVVASGTASTHRTRGDTPPSYTLTRISAEEISVTVVGSADDREVTQTFPRHLRPVRAVRSR